ncbi:MAG: hypothetical protein V9H69_17635 [Anaerolineae bacterium]
MAACACRRKIAVFVGMRFDPRGGGRRHAPARARPGTRSPGSWPGADGVALMQDHARGSGAPGGDTIARLFRLVDQPILILMDEVMSYISRYRAAVAWAARCTTSSTPSPKRHAPHNNVVVAVAIPFSETGDDSRRLGGLPAGSPRCWIAWASRCCSQPRPTSLRSSAAGCSSGTSARWTPRDGCCCRGAMLETCQAYAGLGAGAARRRCPVGSPSTAPSTSSRPPTPSTRH